VAGPVASNGLLKWNFTTGSLLESSPAVADGVVYVGSWDNNVYALYASNSTKLWNYTTKNIVGSSPAVVGSSPAVSNCVVYIGSDDNNVYAIGNRKTATVSKTLMAINNPFTVGAPPLLIDFGVPSTSALNRFPASIRLIVKFRQPV
jgi:outer membrane protein assembly factor BamB